MTESPEQTGLLVYPAGQAINLLFIDMCAAWMFKVPYKSPYLYCLDPNKFEFFPKDPFFLLNVLYIFDISPSECGLQHN